MSLSTRDIIKFDKEFATTWRKEEMRREKEEFMKRVSGPSKIHIEQAGLGAKIDEKEIEVIIHRLEDIKSHAKVLWKDVYDKNNRIFSAKELGKDTEDDKKPPVTNGFLRRIFDLLSHIDDIQSKTSTELIELSKFI